LPLNAINVWKILTSAFHFIIYKMNMSAGTPQKRRYRMSARADAAAATRERVLSAAWRRFAGGPYEYVRLSDIAADAAVSVQTLHTSFGSKDELLSAAYMWWGARVIAGREQAPVGRVAEAIANVFDHYEAHGDAVLRMLAQEERIAAIRQMTDAGRAYHRAWVAKTFAPQLRGLRAGARERRLASIVVATDLLAWKLLRRDMQLERGDAERVVAEMVEG
jgi:AcrR family transcriptional regulator